MTLSVTGWRMLGTAYRRGVRQPGGLILTISDGTSRYFPEDVSLDAALTRVRARGILTQDIEAQIDHWVKTGQGAVFSLERPKP